MCVCCSGYVHYVPSIHMAGSVQMCVIGSMLESGLAWAWTTASARRLTPCSWSRVDCTNQGHYTTIW